MVNYVIKFSSYAEKDKKKLKQSGLEEKARKPLGVIQMNPFQNSPPYEKLRGGIIKAAIRVESIFNTVSFTKMMKQTKKFMFSGCGPITNKIEKCA